MSSTSYDALLNEGAQAIASEQYDVALTVGSQLIALDPESADGHHLRAIAFQHRYEWKKAEEELDQAIEKAPYNAGLFSLRGFARMSLGDYSGAESDLKEAISLENLDYAHRQFVLLLILQERHSDAVDYLIKRIQENPKDPENLSLMADLLRKTGDVEKALTYEKAAKDLTG